MEFFYSPPESDGGGGDRRRFSGRRGRRPPRPADESTNPPKERSSGRDEEIEGASVRPVQGEPDPGAHARPPRPTGRSGRERRPEGDPRERRRRGPVSHARAGGEGRRPHPSARPDRRRRSAPGGRSHGRGGAPGRGSDPRKTRRGLDDLFRRLQQGTSVDPHERIVLETSAQGFSMRAMDLIAPIGKGQRCLIVAPPKAGKTMLLMDVARSVEENHPEITVYALLVDERPEEVTHFRRGVAAKVFAASSDLSAAEHVERAEEAMTEILGRVVEGQDVLLLLDSITRLARAYNNTHEGTGRTLTGGLDAGTMQAPRQIFGAARKIEEGGSLTILGTALIDTGSRMDEVIFQEFKGTGNTELVLSRELFERRIFPCIDISKSGSRKEEKLVDPRLLPRLHLLRRVLAGKKPAEAMSGLLGLLDRFPTNAELLLSG